MPAQPVRLRAHCVRNGIASGGQASLNARMQAGPRPKNILWIVTTQWRGQALGITGDANARTPHIDDLAGRGTVFTDAVTPHPFGPFARAALLTGTLSPENGVCDYFDPLPTSAHTVAHAMGRRGFATAWFGKWHLARRDRDAPLVGPRHARTIVPAENRGGFEHWEGFEGGFLLNDPWLHGSDLPEPACFPGYQSDVVCERAAGWLAAHGSAPSSNGGRPWFCVVSLESPHPPYGAPAAGVAPREPSEIVLRGNVPDDPRVTGRARAELAGYHAHIEATDRAIGRLLERVDPASTAILFTSVHGDMHGSHGLFRKGWPHEESVRVPLLVAVPGEAAGTDDSPVSLVDLSAMTAAIAEGRRWRADRDHVPISMPSVVKLRDQCDRVWAGVRGREWKVVFAESDAPWLAFNLREDPLEMRNLASDRAAAGPVRRAAALLKAQWDARPPQAGR